MCTASADGKLTKVKKEKLKPASDELGPGETTTLELKLTKNTRKQALKALDKGKKVQAKVTVEATGCGRQRGDREAHDQAR